MTGAFLVLKPAVNRSRGFRRRRHSSPVLLQKAVNCTRAQVEDGLALRKAYLLRSQQIARRRQELSSQLQHADTQPGITTSQSGEVCTNRAVAPFRLPHLPQAPARKG